MRATVSSAAVRLVPADSIGRDALGEGTARSAQRSSTGPASRPACCRSPRTTPTPAEASGSAAEPASLACERLGARADVRQHEMRLTL
jgi:hypothetical protein